MSGAQARQAARTDAVKQAIDGIREIMNAGPSVENLTAARALLIDLASQKELFTFKDFPLPTDDAMECSYLIHEDEDGGYSLYVNAGAPHQYYAPHDHGEAWAIIAGVRGRERHKLYHKRPAGDPGKGILKKMGEVVVAAGQAVTMQPDGIHEVDALDGAPLLHLHLYATNFVEQGERWKYDLKACAAERFYLEELGSINDAR